jgi:multidrug efflux system outer membrane protein
MRTPLPRLGAPFVALTFSLTLAGCRTVGPDFYQPNPAAPSAFRHATASASAQSPVALPAGDEWWTLFGDSQLDTLQRSALARSPTLASAIARRDEARARSGVLRSEQRPGVIVDATAQLAGESAERTVPSIGGSITSRTTGDLYRAPFNLSYELDLWGRVRRSVESADASATAAEADLIAVRLSLAAEVAATWFQARAWSAEAIVLGESIELLKEQSTLLRARVDAGLANEFDLLRNQTELAQTEAEYTGVIAARDQILVTLAVLTGTAPAAFPSDSSPLASALAPPPTIPPGLPANAIARRPDVQAAAARLHARTAAIGVAQAAFYPTIRLTGSAGFESPELGAFLERPAQFWGVGPSLTLPLFDGGRRVAQRDIAVAQAAGAEADYRASVLQALRDVDSALIDLRRWHDQAEAQNRALVAARDTVTLARARYNQGLSDFLVVIEAERATRSAARALARNHEERRITTTRLIAALGGAWDN